MLTATHNEEQNINSEPIQKKKPNFITIFSISTQRVSNGSRASRTSKMTSETSEPKKNQRRRRRSSIDRDGKVQSTTWHHLPPHQSCLALEKKLPDGAIHHRQRRIHRRRNGFATEPSTVNDCPLPCFF